MNFAVGANRYSHWWLDRCFLYVGRMAENKGVPQILRVWIELADSLREVCPPLWLVGGEPVEIEAMRHSVNIKTLCAYEAAGKVKWWGYLDAAGISTLLLKAYVLVTHSRYEPGGRVVLEAMAQGIPVIATPHGFAADLIRDWHNGFLVSYDDTYSLCRRMEHFALQPMLRHAMGRRAEAAALAALNNWSFIDSHLEVYKRAIENKPFSKPKMLDGSFPTVNSNTIPRGFDGVYPFESEVVAVSEVVKFLKAYEDKFAGELNELPTSSGHSRLWTASYREQLWIVKHAFSAYRIRPIWDRGFAGSAVETQGCRISNEVLATSFCEGAAPIKVVDARLGLILREWLEPLTFNNQTLIDCAKLLSTFHKSRHSSIDLEKIHTLLNQEWHEMKDEIFIDQLAELQTIWDEEKRFWHVWQPLSIRIAWRWLKLGLSRGWLLLPSALKTEINALISKESLIVADEERGLKIGFCHGDSDLQHFRVNAAGKILLIDCERFHPGYFGHDLAELLRPFLKSMSKTGSSKLLRTIFEVLEPELCTPAVFLSWLKWINIKQICKSYALMETETLKMELSIWRKKTI